VRKFDMAGLEPIRFEKNWNRRTNAREENWDELANKTAAFGIRTNNNLKQLGLDINGASYVFNGDGRSTQTTPIVDRIDTLENTINAVGTRNLGLDLSVAGTITIVASDGTNLSSTNKGVVTFNESSDAGDLVTREVTSNISLALTGAHWGQGGLGDLTDHRLWLLWVDDGSDAIFAVANRGGRETILAADAETVTTSVNATEKVLTESSVASTFNVAYMGWVKANFDDTGNAGGEDFWTIQSSSGDANIQQVQTFFEGTVRF